MPKGNRKKGERRSKSPPPGHDRNGKHQSSSSKRSGHKEGGDHHKLNSMVSGFARTAAAKFTSGLGLGDNQEDKQQAGSTKPGEFDIYLFAQSWAPRFCCTNEKQCKKEGMLGSDDLSPHGLWPAFHGPDKNGRTYPAFCRDDNCKENNRVSHEWTKHGTCTLLDKNSYFEEEEKLNEKNENILKLSDLLNSLAGERISVTAIHEEAGGNKFITLMTNKQCQLQEITTCWEKLSNNRIGRQIECPSHLLGSGRNSAILNGCKSVALDTSGECAVITKDLLKSLKSIS